MKFAKLGQTRTVDGYTFECVREWVPPVGQLHISEQWKGGPLGFSIMVTYSAAGKYRHRSGNNRYSATFAEAVAHSLAYQRREYDRAKEMVAKYEAGVAGKVVA